MSDAEGRLFIESIGTGTLSYNTGVIFIRKILRFLSYQN